MDATTTREQDAAELAASYTRLDQCREAFWRAMQELAQAYEAIGDARRERDELRHRYRSKYQMTDERRNF